jgi:GntR family transcriptional regulator
MTPDTKLSLQLDFRSGLPIYVQIVNQVQNRLAGDLLKPGDQLPTVRALAQELRVNFNTVARAYRMLDEAGVISTQQGRGTYIMEKPRPEATVRLRREALEALARRYIREAVRLGFPSGEITRVVRDQFKARRDADESED